MGFNQNTVSYTPYEVLGSPGKGMREAVLDGLTRGRVSKIDVDAGRDKAVGFAVFDDPLDLEFDEGKVFLDPLVVFSLRIDRLTVPSSTLKLYIRKRVAENLAATSRSKLPREERDQLAEQVRNDLLHRALPAISAYDVVWDTSTGRLRFYSTSQAANEEFLTRARDLLKLELRPMNSVGVLERGLNAKELDKVYKLLPMTYVRGHERIDGKEDE